MARLFETAEELLIGGTSATETDTLSNIQYVQFLDKRLATDYQATAYLNRMDAPPGPAVHLDKFQGAQPNEIFLLGASDDQGTLADAINYVLPGTGTNVITGGNSIDTVMFDRSPGNYIFTHNANGSVTISAPGQSTTLTGFEDALFNVNSQSLNVPSSQNGEFVAQSYIWNKTPVSMASFEAQSFTPLSYTASYADLIRAFGNNQTAAAQSLPDPGVLRRTAPPVSMRWTISPAMAT